MDKMKVTAGTRLPIAAMNVGDVKTKLSANVFWANAPLQLDINKFL